MGWSAPKTDRHIPSVDDGGRYVMSEAAPDTLNRLVSSEFCKAENASRYAADLRQLAEKTGSRGDFRSTARFFKALGNSTRLRIVKLLAEREMCVCEVTVALDLTQPTASHHLGILEREGIVKRRQVGKWVFYSLAKQSILELIDESIS